MPGTTLTISAGENGKFINKSGNVSIFNVGGGKLVVNGGYFESTTACFWLYTTDDSFVFDSQLIINGGTFKANEVISTAGVNYGTILINGGTFYNWNPSDYVNAETHTVTQSTVGSDIVYTVTAK